MKGMGKILKQAAKMQKEMARVQSELASTEVEFSAGGGSVTARVSGDQRLLSLRIEPEILQGGDAEMVEDLVIAAVNGAMDKARSTASEQMGRLTGGLGLPGMGV